MTTPQPGAAPTVRLIDKDNAESHSANLVQANIERLQALFPDAFTEGRIDFEVLKSLLGAEVDEREEKYGLNWHGKRRARQLALTPSTGTLRPCPEESVDWDTTQNLMIEGDNLEVLKLLQKSYAGKVKLIYIDPPYNTGKDFVYPDNFQDSIKNYLELTGQVEGGRKISSNTEESGRFHTDWLNMLSPRIRLGRSLLADDGLMFISINDKEAHNLRSICDELFGDENFVECYVWNSTFRPDNSSKTYRKNAEFILCYAKRIELIGELLGEVIERTGLPSLTKSSMAKSTLSFPASSVTFGIADGSYAKGVRESYELLDNVEVRESTNVSVFRLAGSVIWGQENLLSELANGTKIVIKTDGFVPYVDKGTEGSLRPSKIISNEKVGDVLAANAEVRELFGQDVFSYPKPVSLLKHLIGFRQNQDLVLDFFAGSGTTAHAVMMSNAADGGNRRFILVQLPEPLALENKDQASAAAFCAKLGRPFAITELTKERLRRVGKKIGGELSLSAVDVGFRVFKLDSSNIRAWSPDPDDLQTTVEEHTEHLLPNRSEQDVLYELLLKLGLDLAVPIEARQIAGKTIHNIGAGALMVCLSDGIDRDVAEPLALGIAQWQKAQAEALQAGGDDKNKPVGTKLVFKDSAFADDVAKTNLAAILSQHGLDDVRSI